MADKKDEKTVSKKMTETKEDVKKSIYRSLGHKTKTSVNKFNNELKKALSTAFMAAFGFLIALTWRDVITKYVNSISQKSPLQGEFVSALIVTFVCVIGILVVTTVFKEKEEKK